MMSMILLVALACASSPPTEHSRDDLRTERIDLLRLIAKREALAKKINLLVSAFHPILRTTIYGMAGCWARSVDLLLFRG